VPREVTSGFTAETGIVVSEENFASNEEMLAKLLSGVQRYDLIQPSDYTVEALAREGLLQAIDHAKVPNLANLDPDFTRLPHDPGLRWSVPWMAGSVGIVVNTAAVKDAVSGYRDVFQEKHRGRIVVVDDPRELVTWALATLGRDPNDVTDESLAAVRPVLASWLPLVRVFDSDSPKTALLGGDVDIGVVWSGEAALLWKEDRRFRFVVPAEGAHRYVDSLAVPKDARNPEAAMRFLDYVLRPEVSRKISAAFPYTNPNQAARRLLTPDELANPASYPREAASLGSLRDIGGKAADIDRLVTDLRAAN